MRAECAPPAVSPYTLGPRGTYELNFVDLAQLS